MATKWYMTRPQPVADKVIEAAMVVEEVPPGKEGDPWTYWACKVAEPEVDLATAKLARQWQLPAHYIVDAQARALN